MHCVIGRLYVIWRLTLYKSSNYGNIYRNKQPRKTIQYYFAIYPRINGQVSKDAWRSILAPFFPEFRCGSSSSETERTARREYKLGHLPPKQNVMLKQEQYFKCDRSSTSSATEVILHRQGKQYCSERYKNRFLLPPSQITPETAKMPRISRKRIARAIYI